MYYGTEYGFAREIAGEAVSALHAVKDAANGERVFRARAVDLASLPRGDASWKTAETAPQGALFVVSTHGDGVPPPEARPFFDWLSAAVKSNSPATNGVAPPFSVCALGDTTYTHFCAAGKQLEQRLVVLGQSSGDGKENFAPFYERADINREDWPAVRAWIFGSVKALTDMRLPPRGALAAANGHHGGADTAHVEELLPPGETKSRPLWATLIERQSLCCVTDPASDKDTIRVAFDIAGADAVQPALGYLPGDALGVWPRNCDEEVSRMMAALGAQPGTQVAAPSWYGLPHSSAVATSGAKTVAIEEALACCYDLREAKPQLLAWVREQVAKSAPVANGNGTAHVNWSDAKAVETFASSTHVADVLAAAAPMLAAPLPLSQLPSMLRQLQPRLYSISSSPMEVGAAGRTAVHLTVAIVRYTDPAGVARGGVCSTFVGEHLALGARAAVFVSRNPDFRLPAVLQTPIIMVGPGTGLAPFRSFIAQRLALQAVSPDACGRSLLFFGCRSSDKDFLYKDTLSEWAESGAITLHTAFSRQAGQPKCYVQDVLAQEAVADDVAHLLLSAGAHFYVCGDANHMAGDVDKALRALLAARLPGGPAEAEAFVQGLSDSGRYQRDVWFS